MAVYPWIGGQFHVEHRPPVGRHPSNDLGYLGNYRLYAEAEALTRETLATQQRLFDGADRPSAQMTACNPCLCARIGECTATSIISHAFVGCCTGCRGYVLTRGADVRILFAISVISNKCI